MSVRVSASLLTVAAFGLAACGPSSGSVGPATRLTAHDVALKASDLPSGMQRCAGRSGDLKTMPELGGTQNSQPSATSQAWSRLEANGVIAGWREQYVTTTGACAEGATYATAVTSEVLQFPDQTAAAVYWARTYHCPGQDFQCGPASGLGDNSVSKWLADASAGSSSFCLYAWQQKQFIIDFTGTGLSLDSCNSAAMEIKARIG